MSYTGEDFLSALNRDSLKTRVELYGRVRDGADDETIDFCLTCSSKWIKLPASLIEVDYLCKLPTEQYENQHCVRIRLNEPKESDNNADIYYELLRIMSSPNIVSKTGTPSADDQSVWSKDAINVEGKSSGSSDVAVLSGTVISPGVSILLGVRGCLGNG